LRGDGATFCRNINDFHNSRTAYMVVQPHHWRRYKYAYMRCTCTCQTLDKGRSQICSKFESIEKVVRDEDFKILCEGLV
jgi:hypothetical protein